MVSPDGTGFVDSKIIKNSEMISVTQTMDENLNYSYGNVKKYVKSRKRQIQYDLMIKQMP